MKMKKLVFIFGALSFSLIPLGLMFKYMHWPGYTVIINVGILLFSIIFVPSIAKYLYDKEK